MSLPNVASPHPRRSIPRLSPIWPLLALCCCLSVVRGQYLETTIDLAGANGSVRLLNCIALNPSNHTVYVGGDSWVAVANGASRTYEGRIPIGERCRALCYVPSANKLYAACYGRPDSTVYVIDCNTNQVCAFVVVGQRPQDLCYDPTGNKVYCADNAASSVSVIDVQGDTLLGSILVGEEPTALCYNPLERKVYCANYRSKNVSVIDATADTVVATVAAGGSPVSLCYNPRDNKAYSGTYSSGRITVIDGTADTVLASLSIGGRVVGLCYSPKTGNVYCANAQALAVISGAGDSLTRFVARGYPWVSVLYNPVNHQLYAASNDGRMAVLEGPNDSILTVFWLPDDSRRMTVDSTLNLVFGAYVNSPSVACVDGEGDSLVAVIRAGVRPFSICYNPVADKVYTANRDNRGSVSVIDAATASLLSTIPVGGYPWTVCCDSTHNKVYVTLRAGKGSGDSTVVVVDCEGDTILARVPTSLDPTDLCANPHHPKMYSTACGDGELCLIDVAADTVIKRLPTPTVFPNNMAYATPYDKLYLADQIGNQLMVVDGAGDSVRTVIPIRASSGFAIYHNPEAEKLYAMSPAYVTIIRCLDDQVVKVIDSIGASAACQHPRKSPVFMLGQRQVVVIDGMGDSILTRIGIPGQTPSDIAYDDAHDKVYCADGMENAVAIIDALTFRTVGTVPVGLNPVDMVWAPRHNRMFVANARGSSVSVIRDTSLAVADRQVGPTRPLPPTLVRGSSSLKMSGPHLLVDVAGRLLGKYEKGDGELRLPGPGVYYLVSADGGPGRKLICIAE